MNHTTILCNNIRQNLVFFWISVIELCKYSNELDILDLGCCWFAKEAYGVRFLAEGLK